MIDKHQFYFFINLICCVLLQSCASPKVIEVSVVDITGNGISGAEVHLTSGYSSLNFDVSGKSGPGKYNIVTDKIGITNEKGQYKFWGVMTNSISIVADKDGYYQTRAYPYDNKPIKIPLREELNPVTVLKKKIFRNLPSGDGVFWFDVIVGDLVQPYGRGKIKDFEFQVSTFMKKWGDKEFKTQRGEMRTLGKNDGFIAHYFLNVSNPKSNYSGVYIAPDNGYVDSMKEARKVAPRINEKQPKTWYWTDDFEQPRRPDDIYESFFFRVRSNLTDGPIYGKITLYHGFGNRNTDSPYVDFSYFVNPDGTQNLEVGKTVSSISSK